MISSIARVREETGTSAVLLVFGYLLFVLLVRGTILHDNNELQYMQTHNRILNCIHTSGGGVVIWGPTGGI